MASLTLAAAIISGNSSAAFNESSAAIGYTYCECHTTYCNNVRAQYAWLGSKMRDRLLYDKRRFLVNGPYISRVLCIREHISLCRCFLLVCLFVCLFVLFCFVLFFLHVIPRVITRVYVICFNFNPNWFFVFILSYTTYARIISHLFHCDVWIHSYTCTSPANPARHSTSCHSSHQMWLKHRLK